MTVSTTNVSSPFTGDGVTTTFPFTFAVMLNNSGTINNSADVQVRLNGVVQSGGYTVNDNKCGVGGNVVFKSAPAVGAVGLIVRNVALTQTTALPTDGNLDEMALTNAYDKLTMLAQQINAFSLQLAPNCTPQTIAGLSNGYLQFDSTGTFVRAVAGPISTTTLAQGASNPQVSLSNSGGTTTVDLIAIAAGSVLANATNASAKALPLQVTADHVVAGAHSGGGLELRTVTGTGGISVAHTTGNINVTQTVDLLQHATVNVSSANILAMYGAPVVLIAAPTSGKNLIIHRIMFTMVTTSTQYANGGAVYFQLGNTVHGGGTATTGTIAAGVVTAGAGTSYTIPVPVAYTGSAATGLYISNDTAAFITGTGTAIVDIWYSIQ